MKTKKVLLNSGIITILSVMMIVVSCKKKENNSDSGDSSSSSTTGSPPPPSNPSPPTIYNDGVISFNMTKVITTTDVGFGPTTTTLYSESASAAFKSSSSNNLVDVGTVKVMDSTLKKYSNNVYLFNKKNNDANNGFTNFYSGSITFSISGNSAEGFNPYSNSFYAISIPAWSWTTTPNLTPTVSLSNGFVFKNIYNTTFDSIFLQVIDGGGKVFKKMVPAMTSDFTVTPANLSGMSPTTNTITPTGQIIYSGLDFQNVVVGSKTLTLVRVSSTAYMAHIKN